MTKRHYFQSALILVIAFYLVKTIFKLQYSESVIVISLAIICVLHTMDVRDDITKRVTRKRERENNEKDEQ